MARYNEILVGRYNRFLQKLFGMKGGPPTPQLASEIAPAFPLFSGSENRYLEGWDLFAGTTFLPAQVAATVGFQIRNPTGSNVIAVLEKISFDAGSAVNISISQGATADLPTIVTAVGRGDGRARSNPTCIASSSIASPANLGNVMGNFPVAGVAANPYEVITTENQECTLFQGGGHRIVTNSNNTTLFVNIWCRERFLEDSERA